MFKKICMCVLAISLVFGLSGCLTPTGGYGGGGDTYYVTGPYDKYQRYHTHYGEHHNPHHGYHNQHHNRPGNHGVTQHRGTPQVSSNKPASTKKSSSRSSSKKRN